LIFDGLDPFEPLAPSMLFFASAGSEPEKPAVTVATSVRASGSLCRDRNMNIVSLRDACDQMAVRRGAVAT
jgi:hypothetical protein